MLIICVARCWQAGGSQSGSANYDKQGNLHVNNKVCYSNHTKALNYVA